MYVNDVEAIMSYDLHVGFKMYKFSCIFQIGTSGLINLLLTLSKRSIVQQRTLDYVLLTWASKVFC